MVDSETRVPGLAAPPRKDPLGYSPKTNHLPPCQVIDKVVGETDIHYGEVGRFRSGLFWNKFSTLVIGEKFYSSYI